MIHDQDQDRSGPTDSTYRRALYEGAAMALTLVDRGWSADQLADWLERLHGWRYDADASDMPPMPRAGDGGAV